MDEFDSVSVSTFEAASLAAKLSEKSADGWDVVAIVPAGSDITAYVKRASTASAAVAAAEVETPVAEPPAAEAPPVAEPAGWGTAPESTPTTTTTSESTWGQSGASASGSGWGSGAATSGSSSGWGGGAPAPTATPAAPAQPATPSVPAGWYHDPAGRFELRYWDGSAWTEHVSRNGQQYTDPPVA